MAFNFSVQKSPAYGSYGEFSVGAAGSQIRAQYLLTKIRPGQQGHWENQLASQMAPWREIFKIEELSFDELIQRDLDDSRVAHDLIPYLLGDTGQHARFFPPILAVLVPKREGRSGIAPRYPAPAVEGERVSYGELFDFQKVVLDGTLSPLGEIKYNPQRVAIVIVDGQHRAMAILAMHRQINKSWGADPFAPYYSHIQVDPETVAHIELPVCILFFPDLHEGRTDFKDKGVDLVSVCREIFIVVNRQAKQVSKSRELLLDDEDFAAFMMRRSLSRFKDRTDQSPTAARIYSFAFGDSEADGGSQVMAGQLEFCSAVALHKMHAAAAFSLPASFNLTKTADVTDGRNVRNPARSVEILTGSDGPTFQSLSRRSAKTHTPDEVAFVTEKVGEITDCIMLPLFDGLRPYAAHNQAMRELLEGLNDAAALADPVQAKCRSLLFDGTGNRNVFEEHIGRLKQSAEELKEHGQPIPPHLAAQMTYSDSVSHALLEREESVKLQRAFILFNIDPMHFQNREKATVDADLKELRKRGKAIADALSTQAFQIGYLMAVLSHLEITFPALSYKDRIATVDFLSQLYLAGLNTFFAVSATKHRTLSGYVTEGRASAFENAETGFRGLLAATNVRELNEKQWEFFRYMILEIVHSRMASSAVLDVLNKPENAAHTVRFRASLPFLLSEMIALRNRYFEAAIQTALKTPEFRRATELREMQAKASGKSDDEVKLIVEAAIAEKHAETLTICKGHIAASLGRMEMPAQILRRLVPSEGSAAGESSDNIDTDTGDHTTEPTTIALAVAADELHSPDATDTPTE
jgi:DNA-sulfur modification-associated